MSTSVSVNTYTHSVTYVADNILKSLKDIIRLSGLDPEKFTDSWDLNHRGIKTWLDSKDLTKVMLEITDPKTGALILRWDIDVVYDWSSGDGTFYTDTEQLNYAIKKAGVVPAEARYSLWLRHKVGAPAVAGWDDGTMQSTNGFIQQSLGSTVQHSGLAANTSYWRKVG
jgi:hypothetical protein